MPAFDSAYQEIALRLLIALAIGAAIGLERTYHGRPAGFRTHALVCMSTCLLMLVTVFESRWFPQVADARLTLDPTRMAQGIMTGIGFLGAGAIMKDGLTVRGLTTAASIWITAAIGVMVGIGFYFPAVLAGLMTLGTLSIFRRIENRMPVQFYAQFAVRFARDSVMQEDRFRDLIASHGFALHNLNYRLDVESDFFEYRMVIRSHRADDARHLSETLSKMPAVKEFRLSPTGD